MKNKQLKIAAASLVASGAVTATAFMATERPDVLKKWGKNAAGAAMAPLGAVYISAIMAKQHLPKNMSSMKGAMAMGKKAAMYVVQAPLYFPMKKMFGI